MQLGLKVVALKFGGVLFAAGLALTAAAEAAHAAGAPISTVAPRTTAKGERTSAEHATPTAQSLKRPVIGIGPGLFLEDTDRTDEVQRAGLFKTTEEQEKLESDGRFNLQAWVLFPAFFERLLLGGGVAWINKYTIKDPNDDNEENWDEIGHLVSLSAQGEFMIPKVVSKLNVLLGLRAGLHFAFPAGELKQDLDAIDRLGFSVGAGLPRNGWFAGPHFGVSWPLSERIRVRSDVGVQFSTLTLWSGTAEDAGITSQRINYLDTTRLMIVLGPEFSL
jgi:hypothetical protein